MTCWATMPCAVATRERGFQGTMPSVMLFTAVQLVPPWAPLRKSGFCFPGGLQMLSGHISPAEKKQLQDVTVTHPHQKATVARAVTTPDHAACKVYTRKIREAGDQYRQQGIVITPLVVETLGGWHKVTEVDLRKLGAALARQTGQEDSMATSRLFQNLSVLLGKGNHSMINNRQSGLVPSSIDGIQ